MNTLFTLLFGLSMLAISVLLVVMGIKFLKKQPVKKMKKGLLAAAVVWIGSLAGAGCTTSEPVLPQTLEIVVLQQQEVYDINSQIEVEILVTPENADASSIEYIVAKGNAEFTENTIYVGDVAGQVEVYVSCGEVTSNTVTISVVDVEADKAAKEAEEKAAAEKAAKEAEEKAAAEKAAKEAEEKAAAEKAAKEAEEKAAAEKAAKEAEEKAAAEKAAKEAEAQAAAEKAAKEAEAQAAAEKAAKEAEAQAAAEKAVKEAEAQAAVPTITQPQQTSQ